MTETDYTNFTQSLVNQVIRSLILKGLIAPDDKEPLKDELLTAIDWHCAPRV